MINTNPVAFAQMRAVITQSILPFNFNMQVKFIVHNKFAAIFYSPWW